MYNNNNFQKTTGRSRDVPLVLYNYHFIGIASQCGASGITDFSVLSNPSYAQNVFIWDFMEGIFGYFQPSVVNIYIINTK